MQLCPTKSNVNLRVHQRKSISPFTFMPNARTIVYKKKRSRPRTSRQLHLTDGEEGQNEIANEQPLISAQKPPPITDGDTDDATTTVMCPACSLGVGVVLLLRPWMRKFISDGVAVVKSQIDSVILRQNQPLTMAQ